MTTPECLAFQQAVFEAGDGRALLARRPDLAAHHGACAGCRAWLAAFAGGVESAAGDAGFAASVMARTTRGACARARELAAAALVSRPRFALEAAYALTLVLVLVTGNPLSAVEWTAARVEPLVERVGGPVEAIDARVQALRERMTGGAAASEESADLGATWADRARRTWDDLVALVSAGLSRIVAALESAAAWVRQWTRDVFGGAATTGTEPDAGPAR